MAGSVLTEPQLRSQVAEIAALGTAPEPLAIGLRTSARWDGPGTVDCGGRQHRVVVTSSVLEVREALAEAEESGSPVVILTSLDSQQLGRDVLGRLARGRLYGPDIWQAVLHAFKARRAAPTLRDPALAQALIDHAPPDGYPPVPTGVLDEAAAWRALYRHALGIERRDPDLPEWLRWAASEAGRAAYLRAPEDLRRLLREQVASVESPGVAGVLKMIDSGAGGDAVALAIACGVVFPSAGAPSPLPDAAARLERYHGDTPIAPRDGARLAEAASAVIAELRRGEQHQEAGRHIARADEVLLRIQAQSGADRSRLSILGYTRRLERLAGALAAALAGSSPETIAACEAAFQAVAEHDQAGREPARIEAARMAIRLVRGPGCGPRARRRPRRSPRWRSPTAPGAASWIGPATRSSAATRCRPWPTPTRPWSRPPPPAATARTGRSPWPWPPGRPAPRPRQVTAPSRSSGRWPGSWPRW